MIGVAMSKSMINSHDTFRRRLKHHLLLASAFSVLAGAADAAQAQSLSDDAAASPPQSVEQMSARSRLVPMLLGTGQQTYGGLNLTRAVMPSINADGYVPPVFLKPSLPVAGYVEAGRIGDPDSWVSEEFKLNYGLGMINTQYAYARGLTGKGVQMGIVDDGVETRHSEFAGRNVTSITTADTLADGTRCNTILLNGCWSQRGDRSQTTLIHAWFQSFPGDPNGRQVPGTNTWVADWGSFLFVLRVGHGSHVAGIMGGNRDNNGSQGVAFGANISTARIFGDSISDPRAAKLFPTFPVPCVAAISCYEPTMTESAYTNMYSDMIASGVRVVNNSWGVQLGAPNVPALDAIYNADKAEWDAYLHLISDQLTQAKVVSVFATGNEFGKVAGLLSTLPRYLPEAEPYWLAVANVGRDERIDASSSTCGGAAQWCVATAGTNIWSAQFGTSYADYDLAIDPFDPKATEEDLFRGRWYGNIPDVKYFGEDPAGRPYGFELQDTARNTMNGFQQYTGTSMAAPLVTGAMTLLFERFPYLEGSFVRDILLTTARDVGAPGVDAIYGWGIVDLRKAIEGPGQLIKDSTVNMTSRAGGTKVWAGDAWDAWTNDISGVGRLTKTGPGWLRLTGNNSFNGLTLDSGIMELTGNNALGSRIDITGGVLMLGGRLSGTPLNVNGGSTIVTGTVASGLTTVGANGALSGTGTLADLTVNGTITPGLAVSDMGRLNVSGTYIQNPGSTFNVAVRPVGNAGLLSVLGSATINGGTMNILALPGLYQLDQRYRVLNAAGGLAGRFSQLATTGLDLPFLAFSAGYDTRGVDLNVSRGISFASVAETRNQRAVAGSVDGMANSSSVLNAFSQLTLPQAQQALTETSGEAHAGVQAAVIDASRSVREAVIARHLFAAGAPDLSDRRVNIWADARRSTGERADRTGFARVEQRSDVYLIGADLGVSNDLTVGGFAGWGNTRVRTPLATSARTGNAHIGVYGAGRTRGLNLAAGVVMSDYDAKVSRAITTPGLAQSLQSNSHYQTWQTYADVSADLAVSGGVVQPFGQFVRVHASNGELQETGGNLALSGTVNDANLNIGTVGLRFAIAPGTQPNGVPGRLQLRASAGYRLIGGDRRSTATFALPTGGAFTVASAAVGSRAFVPDVAVGFRLRDKTRLEAGYSGQIGDRGEDHVGNVRLVVGF